MDLKTKFERSAICVGVRFERSARAGSFSSLHNAAFTAPSIGTLVNNDSTSKDYHDFVFLYSLMADGW